MREPEGGFSVPVIGTEQTFEALRTDGFQLTLREPPEAQTDIGTGDRFDGGRTPPRGFGTKVRKGQPSADRPL